MQQEPLGWYANLSTALSQTKPVHTIDSGPGIGRVHHVTLSSYLKLGDDCYHVFGGSFLVQRLSASNPYR